MFMVSLAANAATPSRVASTFLLVWTSMFTMNVGLDSNGGALLCHCRSGRRALGHPRLTSRETHQCMRAKAVHKTRQWTCKEVRNELYNLHDPTKLQIMTVDYTVLSLLLSSPSKKFVAQIFQLCFQRRNEVSLASDENFTAQIADALQLENASDAGKLCDCIRVVIKNFVNKSSGAAEEEIQSVALQAIPSDVEVDTKLRQLIAAILAQNYAEWKALVLDRDTISLPRLQGVEWTLNTVSASADRARMSLPTVRVDLTLQDSTTNHTGAVPPMRREAIEFTSETLETMIRGLGRIRDQLQSVVGNAVEEE